MLTFEANTQSVHNALSDTNIIADIAEVLAAWPFVKPSDTAKKAGGLRRVSSRIKNFLWNVLALKWLKISGLKQANVSVNNSFSVGVPKGLNILYEYRGSKKELLEKEKKETVCGMMDVLELMFEYYACGMW